MRKFHPFFIIPLLFLLMSCAPAVIIPQKNFYDSQIKTIEVNMAKREHEYNGQEKSDEFANQIIVELNRKGYNANLGNKNLSPFLGSLPNSLDDYVKKITNQIGTDAIVFLDCRFMRSKQHLYWEGKRIDNESEITSMIAYYTLYNKHADRLVQTGTGHNWFHKIQDVIGNFAIIIDKHATIDENGVPVFFYRKYLSEPIRIDGKFVIVNSKIFKDDFYIVAMSKMLLRYLPPDGMDEQSWNTILRQRWK